MKKLIALAAFLASGAAFAGGFGSVEYGTRDGVNGEADSRATKVTVGTDINSLLKADVSLRQKTNTDNDLSNTRLEAGLTATQAVAGGLSVYGRGALGEKFGTASNSTYYSVEPGLKYAVTPTLNVKAGYRYRAATNDSVADTTRSWRAGVEYALTKNYSVGAGYDRVRGDSDYNAMTVNVGFKF